MPQHSDKSKYTEARVVSQHIELRGLGCHNKAMIKARTPGLMLCHDTSDYDKIKNTGT